MNKNEIYITYSFDKNLLIGNKVNYDIPNNTDNYFKLIECKYCKRKVYYQVMW